MVITFLHLLFEMVEIEVNPSRLSEVWGSSDLLVIAWNTTFSYEFGIASCP